MMETALLSLNSWKVETREKSDGFNWLTCTVQDQLGSLGLHSSHPLSATILFLHMNPI